jgi:hypothetical protein
MIRLRFAAMLRADKGKDKPRRVDRPPLPTPPPPPSKTIPFQPRPIECRVVHFRDAAGTKSAVVRRWKPGDSGPGGRCRLCRECVAYGDACLIVFGVEVPRDEAPLRSTVGMRAQLP